MMPPQSARMRKIMDSKIFRRSGTPSNFPQYGAVFMANNSTRKECFERKLFGLPYEYADFVMEVKTGMLLFLFNFQERKLYGVFEAASDGAMNIVPDAYKSTSNRKFPAQVRFSTFWHCDPLPERVFCDAIKENYYSQSKFNLSLSRDQVGRLLFLFEKSMLKIPSFPVIERKNRRSSQIKKSVAVTHPSSVERIESFTESIQEIIPENSGNLCASNHGTASILEDYIPLPSIDPEEIEDPSDGCLWDANFSALWSFAKVGGTDDEKLIDSDNRHHVQGWDSDSSKPASCSSGPKSIAQADNKNIDSSCLQVQGMYSDNTNKLRTSVFLRLSGLGKVLGEERHQCSKDNLKDILKSLDERLKTWKCKNSTEYASKSRISVFSRLRTDVGKALESLQKVRVLASETKPMDIAKEFPCQNLKCNSSCSVGTNDKDCGGILGVQQGKALEGQQKGRVLAGEMKNIDVAKEFIRQTLKRKSSPSVEINEKDPNVLPGKQQERRLRRIRKRSRASKTYNLSSTVPEHSEGSSVCTINSACH